MSHDEEGRSTATSCQPNVMDRADLTDTRLVAGIQEAEGGTEARSTYSVT
jgi:hypothetical protein